MKIEQLTKNLHIADDPNFGEYNKTIVHRLLRQVQYNFTYAIGPFILDTCNCLVFYKDSCPTIYDYPPIGHRICLHVKGDDWWRWVFQFAHEYCHHIINGRLTGEITGLMWFEETICHVASIYHLNRLIESTDIRQINETKPWIISCRNANLGISQQDCNAYINSVMESLKEPQYHRDIYDNIATTILPLFEENQNLWKIIIHFGDMREWDSIENLFTHLVDTADISYSESLIRLRNMLI